MGLPDTIVARSRSLMGTEANRLEELILKLEHRIEQNRELERELKTQRLVVDGMRKRYDEENARLAREAGQLRRKAAEEATAIIKRANAAVEKAIRIIREKGAAKEVVRAAKTLIQDEKETLRMELEAATVAEEAWQEDHSVDELKPGDRVCWKRTGVAGGTVLSDLDPTGRFLIAFGKVKAHVPKEELIRAKDIEKSSAGTVSGMAIPFLQSVQAETDVRGMSVEEALAVVDKFLDDTMLAGLGEVRIIHGVGTGALRKSLIPFLNQHPLVQGAHPGGADQKNLGVTIVKMASI